MARRGEVGEGEPENHCCKIIYVYTFNGSRKCPWRLLLLLLLHIRSRGRTCVFYPVNIIIQYIL